MAVKADRNMNATAKGHASRVTAMIGALLFALAVLPYLQALRHDFINYDDNLYVTENPHVLHGLNWKGIVWAFTTLKSGNWHPLTWLSHMLDVTMWDGWAGGHHLTSVLLHGVNTLLLFLIFCRMTDGPSSPRAESVQVADRTSSIWGSALVAALFAIHPLHVESVAWVAERKDVLSSFFGLLALGAYVAYTRQPSVRKYLVTPCLFVLSLLAKPMWVTFPFLLLLIDIWPLCRWKPFALDPGAPAIAAEATPPVVETEASRALPRSRVILEKIPLLLIAAIFSVIAIVSQRSAGSVVGLAASPIWTRAASALVGYRMYLDKLIAPVNLAVFYPHPGHWRLTDVIVSVAILSIITAIAVVCRRRRPWLLIGWLWFLGTLVPVIGLVQVGMHSIADRYTYIPSIGVFVMVAWSLPAGVSRLGKSAVVTAVCAWLAVLTSVTWVQVSYWQNSRSLFTHALKVTRGNFIAHQNLGSVLEVEGNLDGALAQYREAVQESPRYGRIYANIGNVLLKQGRYAEALTELEKSIYLNPNSSTAFNSVGSIALINNRYEDAAKQLKRAVQLDPDNTLAHINYGFALVALGRNDEAIDQLAPITRAEPQRVLARTNLARALAGRGDVDQAIQELQGVLQIAPDYAPARGALREIETKKTNGSGN